MKVAVIQHNYILDATNYKKYKRDDGQITVDQSPSFQDAVMNLSHNYASSPKAVRKGFRDYFNQEGVMSYYTLTLQCDMCHRKYSSHKLLKSHVKNECGKRWPKDGLSRHRKGHTDTH